MNFSDFYQIRLAIQGHDELPATRNEFGDKARERSKLLMRKLYARRRTMDLNAHGKPLRNPEKTNLRFAPARRGGAGRGTARRGKANTRASGGITEA